MVIFLHLTKIRAFLTPQSPDISGFEDPPFSHNPINGVPTCGIWLTPFSADSCHSSWCLRNPVEVVLSFLLVDSPQPQTFGLLKSPPNKKTNLLLGKKQHLQGGTKKREEWNIHLMIFGQIGKDQIQNKATCLNQSMDINPFPQKSELHEVLSDVNLNHLAYSTVLQTIYTFIYTKK